MSFLERDEDLDAMLEEALAFIDECDSDGKPRSTRAGKKPSGCSAAAQRKAPKSNKTQRRVGDSQCYSTQLQQRKKAELRALRDQALELEQQVKLLLQRRQQRQQAEKNPKTQSQEDDSREWFKKAVGEFQRRQKAERTNRKLKEIWANQDKVNGAFRHLVQRRSLLYGKEVVFEDEESTAIESSVEDQTMTIISQLEKSVESLYLASDSVFPPDLPASISCDTRVKCSGDTNGNCIEIVTTTPVSCPLRVAADVVWKDLNVKSQDPERIYSFIRGRKPNSLEKNFLVALHNPSGVLKIDGFQFMRKFEESDRVVVIKHNILTLPHMGLEFRDRCWIIISRSQSDPAHASVARTCCQLYTEGSESFSSNEDVVHTRDYILNSLSGKVRRDHQMLQNRLCQTTSEIITVTV
ncbi:E3 ubiquitin-protein ligase TTC3 [Phytophthora cinnamomi]|uniref:E3 ubiquitin-protein ligase TTC3 n=1 Tax=Phytophthora cinnamomi TaxID=4785 RepID=UPI003559BB02|nr:E3 ubiquitin-protein ligase TTC3 [Phytophthora cinnamomi]